MNRLRPIHNILIDPTAITYISAPDTHVRSHVGVVIHFIKVIVGGQPIELHARSKEEILDIRNQLECLCQNNTP